MKHFKKLNMEISILSSKQKMVAGLRKIDLDDVTLEALTNWREFKCKMTKMIMF